VCATPGAAHTEHIIADKLQAAVDEASENATSNGLCKCFLHGASAGLDSDKMCDVRLFAEETVHPILLHTVGICHSLVLTQMLQPGFDKEGFQESSLVGGVLEHAPGVGAVPFAFMAGMSWIAVLVSLNVSAQLACRTGCAGAGLRCM
jgi:hypothetical protein